MERFARLGIREYFLFDRGRLRLTGWRLGAGRRGYRAILPQQGFFASEVLGLELQVDGARLRFHHDRVPLPEADEMIAMLERRAQESEVQLAKEFQVRAELEQRLAEEARLRTEEARLRTEEARRREAAERQLAEALAELARLRGGPG